MRDAYRRRFRYVLVDEYQDTNRAQYELVRHLAGRRRQRHRGRATRTSPSTPGAGADIQNILDFETDFPGARVLRLEENYRSSQAILDAASALVAHNRAAQGQDPARGEAPPGRRCACTRPRDEFQEAAWVVDRIAALRGRGRAAVLFRMNAQSRLFEEALMRHRHPLRGGGRASASTSARR